MSVAGGLAVLVLVVGALVALAPGAAATNVGGTISVDTTWTVAGSPYVVTSDISIQGTSGADGVTTLTIEPGVEVRLQQSRHINVGSFSASLPGALVADGTSGSPITFTSDQVTHTRGWWGYIYFQQYARADLTVLDNVIVEYGGASTASLYFYANSPAMTNSIVREGGSNGVYVYQGSPTFTGVTFFNNAEHGAYVYTGTPAFTSSVFEGNDQYGLYTFAGSPAVLSNHFNNNAQRPLRFSPDAAFGGNTFQASVIKEIELLGATIAGDRTLAKPTDTATSALLAYVTVGSILVYGTDGPDGITTLTVAPGVEVRFGSNNYLQVATSSASQPGALVAAGTVAQPILFTSNQASKTRGFWSGVYFYDYTSDATTRLENVTIEYGGASNGNVYIYNAAPVFRDCTLRESSHNGMYVWASEATVRGCTVKNNTEHGVYLYTTNPAPFRFENGVLENNGLYGLYANAGSVRVDVTGTLVKGNAQRPLRLSPDSAHGGNTYQGNTIQEIELNGGNQDLDQTWGYVTDSVSGVPLSYHVVGWIYVDGTDGADGVTAMTLEPGVRMKFASGQGLTFGTGSASSPGALRAVGTAAQPVNFTSDQVSPTPGHWAYLQFNDHSDASTLENVTIEYGGSGSSQSLYIYQTDLTFRNLTVRRSGQSGVYVYNANPTFITSTFANNLGHGIYNYVGSPVVRGSAFQQNTLYGFFSYSAGGIPQVTGSLFKQNNQRPMLVHPQSDISDNTYDGNVVHEVEFHGGYQNADQRAREVFDLTSGQPLTYVYKGVVYVQGTDGPDGLTTLTVDPGVTVAFDQNAGLTISGGSASTPGALVAAGTAAKPIRFTSHQTVKTAGWWYGVQFNDYASEASTILRNVTIEYGGGSTAGVYLYNTSPTLSDCTIRNNANSGVYLYNSEPVFDRCTINNNAAHGINNWYGSPVVRDSTLRNNAQYGLYTNSGEPSVTNTLLKQNTQRPLRVAPDSDISGNTYDGNTIREVEFIGGTHTLDKALPLLLDLTSGLPYSYVYVGSVAVQGLDGPDGVTTLTAAPGVTVAFGLGATMTIGSNSPSQPGALVADGTAAQPIVLTSHQSGTKTAGYWGPVYLYDYADEAITTLDNVTVEFGGRSTAGLYYYRFADTATALTVHKSGTHGIYVYDADPVFEGCTVTDSLNHGLYVYVGNPTVTGCLLKGNSQYGLYTNSGFATITGSTLQANKQRPLRLHPEAPFLGNTYRSNVIQEVEFNGGTMDTDQVLPLLLDADTSAVLKYAYTGTIYVRGTDGPDGITSLTVEPGVTVLFDQFAQASFGGSPSQPGALHAVGTAAQPIAFSSHRASPAAGDWYGLSFSSANAASRLENVTVGYGGYGSGANLYLYDSDVVVRNSRFFRSGLYGVHLANLDDFTFGSNTMDLNTRGLFVSSGTDYLLTGNHIHNNSFGVYLQGASRVTVDGNRILDNTNRGAYVAAGSNTHVVFNNVFRNNVNAEDQGTGNLWNVTKVAAAPGANIIGGPYFGGNRWSNYTGLDGDYDGLGDTLKPHKTIGKGLDYHPLTLPSEVIPDLLAPVTTLVVTGTLGENGWYRSAVTATLSAVDDISGVKATYYTLNGGPQQTYASPFSFPLDGMQTLVYWSVDFANNVEVAKNASLKIDSVPPATALGLSGPLHVSGWYVGPVTVTLTATDATSGVAATEYRLDGAGVWTPYAGPFQVGTDGLHTLVYRSRDVAGGLEADKNGVVRVDTLPPVTTIALAGTPGDAGWYRSAVTVTLAATDAGSGVAVTKYRLDDGAPTTYAGPFQVVPDGVHSVAYWSEDNVAHVEATRTRDVKVDKSPPTTTMDHTDPWYTDASGTYVTWGTQFSLAATDATSGVAATRYQVSIGGAFADGAGTAGPLALLGAPLGALGPRSPPGAPGGPEAAAFADYAGPFGMTGADGARTLQYYSRDVAGNNETAQSKVVKLDNTAPLVNVSRPAVGSLSAFQVYVETDSDWDWSPDLLEQALGTNPRDPASHPPLTFPQAINDVHDRYAYAYIVSGTIVPLTAGATDPVVNGVASGMDRVEFYLDGALLGVDATAPFALDWDTSSLTFGAHTLEVRGFDHVGNTRSASVDVFALAMPADADQLVAGLQALLPVDAASLGIEGAQADAAAPAVRVGRTEFDAMLAFAKPAKPGETEVAK